MIFLENGGSSIPRSGSITDMEQIPPLVQQNNRRNRPDGVQKQVRAVPFGRAQQGDRLTPPTQFHELGYTNRPLIFFCFLPTAQHQDVFSLLRFSETHVWFPETVLIPYKSRKNLVAIQFATLHPSAFLHLMSRIVAPCNSNRRLVFKTPNNSNTHRSKMVSVSTMEKKNLHDSKTCKTHKNQLEKRVRIRRDGCIQMMSLHSR